MDEDRTKRVVFHEITNDAVAEAFAQPRNIDMKRVDAQQARRILDRLVGYQLSPLLWRKVRSRTSAGRVQSIALRMVVEREQEIDDFNPVEYWSLEADLAKTEKAAPNLELEDRQFRAKLTRIQGEKIELSDEAQTQAIVDDLEKSIFRVEEVKKGERRRRPAAPFTTSTLQQEASRRLGFGARKTMSIAQQLYEGIEIGSEGIVGLITYMRTDSTTVSKQAQDEARTFIVKQYGNEMLPPEPPIYKTKSKSAQEAHEAVRPTSVLREPHKMKSFLSRDQARLYTLIWQRFVSSQMANALYDTMTVAVGAGPAVPGPGEPWAYRLRASGSRIRFKGFLTLYEETRDEDAAPDTTEGVILPELVEGESIDLLKLLPEQHFTQPPPRYTEASLVKALEEHGIGRPSTYAPIISTIQNRGYVERYEKRLYPTELGEIVNDLLVEYFPDVINVKFTSHMENDLDRIARGEMAWKPVLNEFYEPFSKDLAHAEAHMPEVEIEDQPTGEMCEKCGHPMVIKWGRYGKFEACSNFPECRNAKPHLVKLGIPCPNDGGELVERRTKKGRVFYGCANYPECEWSSWKRPLPAPCPNCGGLLVQKNRNWAQCLDCEEQIELSQLPDTAPKEATPETEMAVS
jgi:DNA topoisomerase-1